MIGASTFLKIPPTWNNGMKLQQISSSFKPQDAAMAAAPIRICDIAMGTTFFFPVLPDVCRIKAKRSACMSSMSFPAESSSVAKPYGSPMRVKSPATVGLGVMIKGVNLSFLHNRRILTSPLPPSR